MNRVTSTTMVEIGRSLRGAMRHELALRLLREIFSGVLPAGKRLMIVDLTKRFGTSSTPAREALIELTNIGVVEFIHNRGVVVRPFGPVQLREIYQLRQILEAEATYQACGRIDQAVLLQFKQEQRALATQRLSTKWLVAEMEADRNLHAAIAKNCGSVRLAEEIRRYDALVQTTRDVIGFDRHALVESTKQHIAVIDALLAGDADAAKAAMLVHVQRVGEALETAILARK